MVSVIIPALNEEQTIGRVISLVKSCNEVDEIIVLDDKSVDATVEEAKQAGAVVITSPKIGKGASMRDGLLLAKNEILLYLDADIEDYITDIVSRMVEPILNNTADIVKSTFDREAGRVTELVAKPLLSLLFPEALRFSQPLSGMIAGRKSFLSQVTFENDYGVDIGILLDLLALNARVMEVNIGMIHHKMKPWQQLGKMSREVSRAILKRAGKSRNFNLEYLETINVIRDQLEFAIKESVAGLKKMVIFDMDDTLLQGRFIEVCAKTFDFEQSLIEIRSRGEEPYLMTKLIATLMKGLNIAQIIQIADSIPLVPDTLEVVEELRKRGYIVGIISDSYDIVVQHIRNKIGADFALGNELEFSESTATGEVKVPSFFMKMEKGLCHHSFCKTNALAHVAEQYGIDISNIIAIGDSENDICIVKATGIGVAFCSTNKILNAVADHVIEEKRFESILGFAQ